MTVQAGLVRTLKEGLGGEAGSGPVVYWMFRDQRVRDNWTISLISLTLKLNHQLGSGWLLRIITLTGMFSLVKC